MRPRDSSRTLVVAAALLVAASWGGTGRALQAGESPGEAPSRSRARITGPSRQPAQQDAGNRAQEPAEKREEQPAGDPKKGKLVFFAKCRLCHSETSAEGTAPGFKGLFDHDVLPRSGLKATEENVRKVILEGYKSMQPFRDKLTDQELDDLIAYLRTL